MDFFSFLSGLKEVVVTLAAATGAIVAYKGLKKWKEELEAKSSHETAKVALTATFQLRKAVHRVRRNLISPDEFPEAKEVSDADRMTHVFKRRWEALDEAFQDLESAKVQGQALWGKDFERAFEPLNEIVNELNYSINEYLTLLKEAESGDGEEDKRRTLLEHKRTIFHVPVLDAQHDSFADRLHRAIRDIERVIRGHL